MQFLLFDDQKVIKLGGWEDVKRECLRSSFQPVLLLYEIENSVAESPRSRDAAAVNRQQEFFEFRAFARNKPRNISPIQVRPSGGVTVSAALGGGPKKTGKEILRSKSPVAREWVARGAEESNYPMTSPGPPSPNPKPPKSAHERANSLTGYALGEIFNSPCSDSFTSKDYRDSTIKNPLMSNPKEKTLTSRGLKSRDKIQPIEIFKKRLEVKRVILKLNGKMSSGKPRSPQKSVLRALYDFNFPDKNEELNILGIEHSVNKKGHVIVIGFAKHPLKGECLSDSIVLYCIILPNIVMFA